MLIPALVSAVCCGAASVPDVVTVAAATVAVGIDTVSMADRCPVWGFASNCWASGKAYNYM